MSEFDKNFSELLKLHLLCQALSYSPEQGYTLLSSMVKLAHYFVTFWFMRVYIISNVTMWSLWGLGMLQTIWNPYLAAHRQYSSLIRGDGRRFHCRWRAHSALYGSSIVEKYPWSLCEPINQLHPNTFNKSERKIKNKKGKIPILISYFQLQFVVTKEKDGHLCNSQEAPFNRRMGWHPVNHCCT